MWPGRAASASKMLPVFGAATGQGLGIAACTAGLGSPSRGSATRLVRRRRDQTLRRLLSLAGAGARVALRTHKMRLDAHAHAEPHPRKPRSEDAYFTTSYALGLADGVGSWAARGVDSGAYARGLMDGVALAVAEAEEEERLHFLLPKPLLLLQAGYREVSEAQLPGSSTALVATVLGNLLRTVSLGDSGLLVVRGDQVVHRTAETVHSWNHPFQLGMDSRDGPVSRSCQQRPTLCRHRRGRGACVRA